MYNITKRNPVYRAITCTGLGRTSVKIEPWHHLVYDKDAEQAIIFVWDSREVVDELYLPVAATKHQEPGTWQKAKDSRQPLKNCKLQDERQSQYGHELRHLQHIKDGYEQHKITDRDIASMLRQIYDRNAVPMYASIQDVDDHIARVQNLLED